MGKCHVSFLYSNPTDAHNSSLMRQADTHQEIDEWFYDYNIITKALEILQECQMSKELN